jgi:glutathione S-transferase
VSSAAARERAAALLTYFERELAASSTEFLAGDRPGALDAYLATFLTPLAGLTAEHCPGMHPGIHTAFDTLREEMGAPLPPSLAAHHARMFARHLPFPIPL